jgi:hypothetical protein
MRTRLTKSANTATNSFTAASFRSPACRPADVTQAATAAPGQDFGRTPVHSGQRSAMSSFPHSQILEPAFQHNIPGCAVVDGEGCAQRGVPAFTDRITTHFASPNPPLRVAAHEAAHVVQHAGLSRDAHLGAERHAEAISQAIARGAPVGHLIGSAGASVEPHVRHYTEMDISQQRPDEWNAGKPVRVADDGLLAVAQDSGPNHAFWADPGLIADSNTTLASKKSVIRLKSDAGTLKGSAPGNHSERTLSRVLPENQSNNTSGDSMEIWADCGRSGRDVMGAGEGTGGGKMSAKYQDVHRPWYSEIPLLGPLLSLIFGGAKKKTKTTEASDPKGMKEEIFNQKLGGSDDEGLKKYQAMSPEERKRFDKETGINRFATPGTGEGFTMSSGGDPVPGNMTWNFHWAGVVASSGPDRVTLENYSISVPSAQNAKWEFQMYGPPNKPDQTFYEQHKASGQHGDAPTALPVEKTQ